MIKNVLLGLICVFLFSCKKENKVQNVERAFYYWKSDSYLNSESTSQLNINKVTKIYMKFFEIDYSEAMGNFPFDKISNYEGDENFEEKSIIPTIFIKNEIFKYNSEKELDVLAENIIFLINKKYVEKFKKMNPLTEIQLDCDWTKSTKEKYFYLLKKIKEKSNKQISCTLRLYPYKYSDIMGVPPVDKVILMCYNLIKPLSNSNKNSILDIDEFKKYLNEKRNYPLHIDIALPVFSWSQLFQNNHFQKLININKDELTTFTKQVKPMWYEVTKDTTINWDNYFRVADQIKFEDVSVKTINDAIEVIKKNVPLENTATIALFDLDDSIFNRYNNEEISSFYSSFSK